MIISYMMSKLNDDIINFLHRKFSSDSYLGGLPLD